MKKLLITEDEKERILGLYLRKINEQTFNKIYSDPKTKISSEQRKKDIERYFNNREIVTKLIKDRGQLTLWNEMVSDVTQKPFIADIVRHIEANPLITGILLRKSADEVKETELNENPALVVSFDEQKRTNFYFRDNEWELTEEGKKDIEDTIFAQILLNIKENPDSRKCVDSLLIDSSASRFRNTGNAERYSFAQLSKLRNDSIRDYIMGRLNEIGITLWCSKENNITQNVNGSNGDGTSGPNPPKPTPFIPKGQSSMTPPSTDETKRNDFGEPHRTKEEYDAYKYTKPTLTVAFEEKKPDIPDFPLEKTIYDVEFFKGKTKTTTISSKNNSTLKKLPKPNVIAGVKMVPCPIFNKQ
jgi:hypothetical protein